MLNSGSCATMGPLKISQALQDGEKFIKWDDDSGIGTPVTMRIDPSGFFLYWIDQNNEMDILDITSIRDVRTGQYAKKPKDTKLRQIVTLGSQDTLEEKTITICHGADFVNITFLNFSCTKKEIAQLWCNNVMKLAYSLEQINGSVITFLKKAHTKLCLQTDKIDKIPVKNIIKVFTQNKDDRKRVEKALENTGLPSGKTETVAATKFTFEEFYNLYKNLCQRAEVEKIFDNFVGNTKRKYMSTAQLVEFLNKTQRDPRLNEILYPYANTQRAKEIIQQYEPNKFNIQKGLLSLDGFLRYLMSEDNPVISINKFDLCDDMDQPLSHYFINSSHNTYLTGHQLTGKSSVEIYRQCLLAGCRCVELDFWNGRTEEPVIVHGYTFVPEIFAKDVLEAIAESAFKTCDFPVILSFENHCNPRQQAKIANYCREVFGEMLLDQPLDTHPLEPNIDLPPPSSLKRKIIIKNKKKHHHHHHKKPIALVDYKKQLVTANTIDAANKPLNVRPISSSQQNSIIDDGDGTASSYNSTITPLAELRNPSLIQVRQSSKDSTGSSETESSSEDESQPTVNLILATSTEPPSEKAQKETEAGAEISALVNYVQPVHFSSFENAEKKNRCYEMSSFDEKQATTLLKERPIEFVNYNKHQLSRVYPTGTRFDSSNFMPQLFWNAGCQLVALNFQTLDLAMQLNLGIFEYNGRSGYLLKPEFMRRTDRRLDPFAESTVDGIIAGTVSITVLSGQFLSDKRVGTYVEVDMFGLPADTVRKKFRTKMIRDNSINPIYDEEPFVFKKVVLPELASIRVAAYEEGGKFIGHRVLPVIGLCPGYRHLSLRNELGQPLPLSSLFLCIVVKDYIPDDLSNFAEALANPIKYQNELEKRDKQLAVLTEDTEPTQPEENEVNCAGNQKKELKTLESIISPKHRISLNTVTSAIITSDVKNSQDNTDNIFPITQNVQHQHSLESNVQTVVRHADPSQFDIENLVCEPLEAIIRHKLVREKCLELEKKLESLRKKHDKEKLKVFSTKLNSLESCKRQKFAITNKLVKRLSTRSFEHPIEVPPCVQLQESTEDLHYSSSTTLQNDRLLLACKDYSQQYRELQEKYLESIYNVVEKVMHQSQANQIKQLKSCLERVTSEVMHQLQEARRSEVKTLASIHRDRDEFIRMKREVASSIVERGVAERIRLKQTYDNRTEELQKQHEVVRISLAEHKSKARDILRKDNESHTCIMTNGILELFLKNNATTVTADSAQKSTIATESNNNPQSLNSIASHKPTFEVET